MSIETLLEAAKFVEWSSQLQHSARDNERHQIHSEKTKPTGPAATPPPPPQPVVTHPQSARPPLLPPASTQPLPKTPPAKVATRPITSPLSRDAPWKTSPPSHTSPRLLETSSVSNRPVVQAHQVLAPPHHSPQRALTPPTAATSYLGFNHQYRPLAPVPSQSPNSKSPPFIAFRHVDSYDSNSNQSLDQDSNAGDDKKSDTREVHNKLEKNRRAHLKDCFDNLKAQVPNMEDKKIKTSNLSILQGALRYLQALKRKERELEHQLEKLARQKITYQQRLAKLKMEKGVTEDQLPWHRHESEEEEEAMEAEEERSGDDDDQASTSTASEAEEEERKSRAQSPVLPPQPQPQLQPQLQAHLRQPNVQTTQPRNRTPDLGGPKVMHSVTKEIHSGPYVISRHIITHMAQPQPPNRQQRTETLPIISQLARKQAGKPMIGAFEERRSVMGKTVYPSSVSPMQIPPANSTHSTSQSGTSVPVAMQHIGVNSQSGSRQTVSQLLGKQAPGVRAPARRPTPGNYTSVIQTPVRQPITPAMYPSVPVCVVGVTTSPSTATTMTIASKHVVTTAVTSMAVSRPVVSSGIMYSSATTKSVIQPAVASSSVGPTSGSTLRPISPATHGAQIQSSANGVTLASVAPPTALPPRTVGPSFLSPLAMQPSALTQVLFTQPPVAAYSLAQSALANPLIPSALPQTVLRPPVAVTTVTQSVITQIISTQPMTTIAAGKVAPISTHTITTPAIAPMVRPAVASYPSLATLGVAPYPVTLGPPLALNKALVTTTPSYTTLPLGTSTPYTTLPLGTTTTSYTTLPLGTTTPSYTTLPLGTTTPSYTLPLGAAALQKLTMSSLPFQNPAIPITAGTTQAAILSTISGLGAASAKVPAVPMTMPVPLTTPVINNPAIRPRVTVDPTTMMPAVAMATGVNMATTTQHLKNTGARYTAPKSSGVKSTGIKGSGVKGTVVKSSGIKGTVVKSSGVKKSLVSKKDKTQQGRVTTSHMEQIMAVSNKTTVTNTKSVIPAGTKPSPSNSSKSVTVNQ